MKVSFLEHAKNLLARARAEGIESMYDGHATIEEALVTMHHYGGADSIPETELPLVILRDIEDALIDGGSDYFERQVRLSALMMKRQGD
jgi:hypothetical protein